MPAQAVGSQGRGGACAGGAVTPTQFYATILAPSARFLRGISAPLDSAQARVMLLAIAGQESAWTDRIQIPGGEARGFWQCEEGGAVNGVLLNDTLHSVLAKVGDLLSIDVAVSATVFEAIAWNDALAYAVGRLALWADPHPLPAVGDINVAWDVYTRVWRPGKPSRDRWSVVYLQALSVIKPV
jgi:hypothetical protein